MNCLPNLNFDSDTFDDAHTEYPPIGTLYCISVTLCLCACIHLMATTAFATVLANGLALRGPLG